MLSDKTSFVNNFSKIETHFTSYFANIDIIYLADKQNSQIFFPLALSLGNQEIKYREYYIDFYIRTLHPTTFQNQ